MSETKASVNATCEYVAENIFIKFGYNGWTSLSKVLLQRIREHDKASARPRTELQRSRPARLHQANKEKPKPVKFTKNKTFVYRMRTVETYAPHLLPLLQKGEIKLKPAYEQAMNIKRDIANPA